MERNPKLELARRRRQSGGSKRSDQWSPDGGTTIPWANGIPLTQGTAYYIEAIHHGGTGGNSLGVTAVLTNDVAFGSPTNGEASTLTNSVISYVTTPVTNFAFATQPQNQSVFEGINYAFTVVVATSNLVTEITPLYQWTEAGVDLPGATLASYNGVGALVDDQQLFACKVTIPGVTNNALSASAKLTVTAGVYFPGTLRQERWNNDTTVTRALVGSGQNGTPPDVINNVASLDLGAPNPNGNNLIRKISGYFIPPVTTNYIFFIASDDDGDLFLSTDASPAHKKKIASENNWSNRREWLTSGGGSVLTQKRSDSYIDPATGLYVDPENDGVPLIAGNRYYIEAVSHQASGGAAISATYKYNLEPDPAGTGAGTARLNGTRIQVLTAPSTVLTITTNLPPSVTRPVWEPVYFTVVATNDSTLSTLYQWRRNDGSGTFTNIPNASSVNYGFLCSTNDNGAQFNCVVSSPGLTKTSLVATLTVTLPTGATLLTGSLAQELWIPNAPGNIDLGSLGYANVRNSIGLDNSGRPPQAGGNFGRRAWGFFNPPVTTNYVFYVCSDDQLDLYVSTDDQPNNRVLAAQETGWSNWRQWATVGGGGSSTAQRRSDQWSIAPGIISAPWANGFPMVAGGSYYIEIQHRETGGGDDMAVTYKILDPLDPLANDPTNNAPSELVGPLISHYVPARTLTVTASPTNTIIVSWDQLAGGVLTSTTALDSGVWTAVAGTSNPRVIAITGTNLFLRLSEQ